MNVIKTSKWFVMVSKASKTHFFLIFIFLINNKSIGIVYIIHSWKLCIFLSWRSRILNSAYS